MTGIYNATQENEERESDGGQSPKQSSHTKEFISKKNILSGNYSRQHSKEL